MFALLYDVLVIICLFIFNGSWTSTFPCQQVEASLECIQVFPEFFLNTAALVSQKGSAPVDIQSLGQYCKKTS